MPSFKGGKRSRYKCQAVLFVKPAEIVLFSLLSCCGWSCRSREAEQDEYSPRKTPRKVQPEQTLDRNHEASPSSHGEKGWDPSRRVLEFIFFFFAVRSVVGLLDLCKLLCVKPRLPFSSAWLRRAVLTAAACREGWDSLLAR